MRFDIVYILKLSNVFAFLIVCIIAVAIFLAAHG